MSNLTSEEKAKFFGYVADLIGKLIMLSVYVFMYVILAYFAFAIVAALIADLRAL